MKKTEIEINIKDYKEDCINIHSQDMQNWKEELYESYSCRFADCMSTANLCVGRYTVFRQTRATYNGKSVKESGGCVCVINVKNIL